MLQIGICDDSSHDRAALRDTLCDLPGYRRFGDLHITEYASGEALAMDVEAGRGAFDLLLLDIYMTGMNGMETARELRALGVKTPLVFLTTSPDFALESYDVEAAGYLLKPPNPEKLGRLLEKLLSPPARPRLAVKCAGRRQYCEYDELLYLESSNNVTILHLLDGQQLRCGERLNALQAALDDPRFLRCHQSFLVNMDHIKRVEEDFVLCDGSCIPIRVRSRRELTDAYYNYFVSNTVAKLPEEDAYV
ncbi:LytTR family DNA-binding domain-containing protein [Oscillibacter sp.]|uniref:LytR/AlgR family response regulator transcription factor n=1 Tax=Oscillibacter sp. TaxID=1945593 RepID=UPI002626C3FD|nr:LytTR family DNA-binding domain-containing protein [Oscillibacter sp.]MDD3346678.1 LytTR family DNA-binding domain-containing protein [Oscillibacter sp.]